MVVLLALVAQVLAIQLSARHAAGALTQGWLLADVCSAAGVSGSVPLWDQGDESDTDDSLRHLAHCPMCSIAAMQFLPSPSAPVLVPQLVVDERSQRPVISARLRLGLADLLPPAQGPPVIA